MQLAIIHFSDIHFKEGKNVILSRTEKIFNVVKNLISKHGKLFIITSGDIAYSGQQKEYKIAIEFYKDLGKRLHDYTSLTPAFLFVPGNHDCYHDVKKAQIRSIVLKDIVDNGFNDLSEQVIQVCCDPQADFFTFEKDIELLFPCSVDIIMDHPLLSIRTFKLNGQTIKFNLYNSAWSSSLKEQIGGLKFPIEYLQDKIPSTSNLLSVSVVHHPFNWQHLDTSKKFREALAKSSEIIITGHEHQNHTSIYTDYNEEYKTIHIESGALQENDNDRTSEFNFLNINTDALDLEIHNFKYVDGKYELTNKPVPKKIEKDKK